MTTFIDDDHHPGRRTQYSGGYKLGNQEPADRVARAGELGKQDKDGDIVEPVAGLADHARQPQAAEFVVFSEQGEIGPHVADRRLPLGW